MIAWMRNVRTMLVSDLHDIGSHFQANRLSRGQKLSLTFDRIGTATSQSDSAEVLEHNIVVARLFNMVPVQWIEQPVALDQFSCKTIVPGRLRAHLEAQEGALCRHVAIPVAQKTVFRTIHDMPSPSLSRLPGTDVFRVTLPISPVTTS